jgi:hypothetical protein
VVPLELLRDALASFLATLGAALVTLALSAFPFFPLGSLRSKKSADGELHRTRHSPCTLILLP